MGFPGIVAMEGATSLREDGRRFLLTFRMLSSIATLQWQSEKQVDDFSKLASKKLNRLR
ncbi:hypothetical protein Q669_28325 [Labrenzia sp. C1B10]|nr:hypothetical protein Q669_28325 [Labrenzia sp. C1B10]ERS06401.1 hypothetical protein Q675_26795 [Labrenzia sp. C1B70]